MYCDCCGKRLDDYPKGPEHPLCGPCFRGDCYDEGHR
jgi:hypothetical protein